MHADLEPVLMLRVQREVLQVPIRRFAESKPTAILGRDTRTPSIVSSVTIAEIVKVKVRKMCKKNLVV